MSSDNGLTVTSGATWRQGELQKLPSGNVAMLRKPNVLHMIRQDDGSIPDVLMQFVMGSQGKQPDLQGESGAKILDLVDAICKAAFISPRIVEHATKDDEIELSHLSLEDQMWVTNWAMGAAVATASRFPDKSVRDLADRRRGASVRDTAKPTA